MDGTVIDANATNSSVVDSLDSSPDFVINQNGNGEGNADGSNTGNENGDGNADGKGAGDANANADANADANQDGDKDKDKNLDDRFDKHPRFQELNKRAVTAEAKLSLLESSPFGTAENDVEIPVDEKGNPLFKDITKMSADELREWHEDDPVGYAKNLQQMTLHQVGVQTQANQNNAIRKASIEAISKTFDSYAEQNPDFNTMWDNGDIPKYMKEHPGHNAISAHMALTGQKTTEAKIKEAVDKAVKDTEAKMLKNFQAKKNAHIITPGAQSRDTGDKVDKELENTQQGGGRDAVLARRLSERRQRAASG